MSERLERFRNSVLINDKTDYMGVNITTVRTNSALYVCRHAEQLESENERLRKTLKQIQLKAASPGLHFIDRLTDIQKLAKMEESE
ncbi:hypothetical protein [Virgibacillus siamensis]|uniref:hypothetical protein n=1 Tax=Virgibacillus siamensis TaxID=480071 RepID=UPI000987C909|nr:hypothetical protein [Virgibacillus siamensis]